MADQKAKRVDHSKCPGAYTMPKRKTVLRLVDQALAKPGGDIDWNRIASYAGVSVETAQWLWDTFGENVSHVPGEGEKRVIDGDELLAQNRKARKKNRRPPPAQAPVEVPPDALDA